MLGFGIIGCGMIASFHAKAIADVRGAKLVACFDQVPAAADKLAEATGCKACHRLEDLLADPAVNVVTIGTPSGPVSYPAPAEQKSAMKHYGPVPAIGEHTDKVRAEFSLPPCGGG